MTSSINYKKIYADMLDSNSVKNKKEFIKFLEKDELNALDVIEINQKMFGVKDKEAEQFNQRHRFYNQSAILEILDYQKRNGLNNFQLAKHFKLSRNTVSKWKKMFENE